MDFFFWQVVHIFHLLHYHHFLLPILHPGIQRAEQPRQKHPPHRHFQHLYELCNLGLLQFHLLFWQLSLLPLWHKKIQHVKNGAIQYHLTSISTQGDSIQKIVSSLLYLITFSNRNIICAFHRRLQSYRHLKQHMLTCTCMTLTQTGN